MSEQPGSNAGPVLKGSELGDSAGVLGVTIIIWALTGHGYFWPIWVAIGLGFPLGITTSLRWGRSRPWSAFDPKILAIAAVGVDVSGLLIVIWLITGMGYFWPIWTVAGTAVLLAVSWLVRRYGTDELELRVDELQRTRSGALDVQATELRRIERDLHDGAQARLVALSMKLGRAEERFASEPETASLLREARQEAAAAIAELRELARGIAPPVLSDRGLEAAVRSLAERSGAEVSVSASDLGGRRPAPVVETAAYFVVAESLTNAAKHAPGATVEVSLAEFGGELVIEITDLGPGGAVPTGSGLTGLRQRVEALDGQLSIISPPGVGTRIEAVLPCGW